MAVLYTYPIKSTPANRNDLVIISDSRDGNKTKQIAVANLPGSASFSGIGGSGTVNYIPKFSTSTDLVDSIVYESSSKIGIGTTSPAKTLDVNGDVTFGTGNKFETEVNALKGLGANGVFLRSAISSAANPSFSNSDDTNTGMFLPGSDVLGLSTAGLERFRITSSGNVGIGTASPSADGLQIANKSSVTTGTTQLFITGNSSGQSLLGLGDNNNNYTQHIASNHVDNSMRFYTNSSYPGNNERLRITSTGNVGIGTTAPGEKLEVTGKIKATGTADVLQLYRDSSSQANYIKFYDNATSSSEFYLGFTSNNRDFQISNLASSGTIALRSGGGNTMMLDSSQRVGIGTTSPAAKLQVNGASGTTYGQAIIGYGTQNLYIGVTGTNVDLKSSGNSTGSLSFTMGNIERMRITSTGKVGIGTASPIADGLEVANMVGVSGGNTQLFITGNTSGRSVLGLGDGSNRFVQHILTDHTQNMMSFHTGASAVANNEKMRITSGGDVGIGTTAPSDGDLTIGTPKLHVAVGGTSGTFNLAARFQSTTVDADNTGTSVLINSQNDRGLLIKAGRKDGDREVAYFDVVTSIGNTTNMLTMGKFDTAYNVGIGTTTPAQRLDVEGKTRSKGLIIYSVGGVNAGNTTVLFDNTLATKQFSIGAGIVQNTQEGFAIRNVTDSRTDVYIDNTGNVGIGTYTPSNKLTVGALSNETSIATASTGFDSLRLGTLTFPAAAGWYRVASYSVAGARGGARIDLSITGGAFAPVTYSIDYFKSYTQTGTDHTLKLEQYGGPAFITKARIAFSGTNTYIEVYKIATTSQGTMPAQVHFNRLIGESGGSLPLFGTPASGSGSTSLKEVEFIAKGTSVEALQVQGGNLNLKNLPTSASGLTAGDIYNDGGTLKIVS